MLCSPKSNLSAAKLVLCLNKYPWHFENLDTYYFLGLVNNFPIQLIPHIYRDRGIPNLLYSQTSSVSDVPFVSYLSGQGQEVAVELHVGHDLCQVLVVLYVLIKLQEHAMATQHEGHLLLDNSARQREFVFHTPPTMDKERPFMKRVNQKYSTVQGQIRTAISIFTLKGQVSICIFKLFLLGVIIPLVHTGHQVIPSNGRDEGQTPQSSFCAKLQYTLS